MKIGEGFYFVAVSFPLAERKLKKIASPVLCDAKSISDNGYIPTIKRPENHPGKSQTYKIDELVKSRHPVEKRGPGFL
jgi:hypothetical protein